MLNNPQCLLIFILSFATLFARSEQMIDISLSTSRDINSIVYVVMEGETEVVVDSLELKNGFANGVVNLVDFEIYRIVIPSLRFGRYLIPETGTLFLDVDTEVYSGLPLNELYNDFSKRVDNAQSIDTYLDIMIDYMGCHANDVLGSIAFYDYLFYAPSDSLSVWYNRMGEVVRSSSLVRHQLKMLQMQSETGIGKHYKDVFSDVSRKDSHLSHYVAGQKLTIVDFWASWCTPCLRSFSYLEHLYLTYHKQGVNVVGIAVQEPIDHSKATVDKYKLTYPQIYGAGNAAADLYGSFGLPFIVVIDSIGNIVARNIRADKVEGLVREKLSK